MNSRYHLEHRSRHGRSISGDSAPRMQPLMEGSDGKNLKDEGTAGTSELNGGRVRKMTRRYSLNEDKLKCMRVRQTSFEAISDNEMPQLGRVRTRRWSTSWRIPMGELKPTDLMCGLVYNFVNRNIELIFVSGM